MRLRRALFQVHLWTALILGVYIVVISVSGSIVVFRREASIWFIPRTVASTEGERLTGEALDAAVRLVYADYEVVSIAEPQGRRGGLDPALRPVDVALVRDGVRSGRVFDPYAAQDLGDNYPPVVRWMEWTVRLHDDLFMSTMGRRINGIGGALVLLLIFTGAVIWWQGKAKWWRGTLVSRATRRPIVWQLHSALAFWSFALLFIWAVTAVYFAFPTPVEALIDYFDPNLEDFERPGEQFLLDVIGLHFGRFGGLEIRITWAILGLAPAVLFITGFILWWRRVVRPRVVSRVAARGSL